MRQLDKNDNKVRQNGWDQIKENKSKLEVHSLKRVENLSYQGSPIKREANY